MEAKPKDQYTIDDAIEQSIHGVIPLNPDPHDALTKVLSELEKWKIEPKPIPKELVIRKPDELLIIRSYRTAKSTRFTQAANDIFSSNIKQLSKLTKKK